MQRLVALDPDEQSREEAGYLQDSQMDRTDTDFTY